MKKTAVIVAFCFAFVAGGALAERVHDWHDLDEVHKHVTEAIHEMERARAANHYDLGGHGAKAEEHLRAAEHELDAAVRSARRD
jgi:nicotinic acid mononucleotide adenylyltransferase